MAKTTIERFEEKYQISTTRFYNGTPCWEWTAYKEQGYGVFYYEGKRQRAHRVACALHGTPIPEDKVSDHLCRNRACVNPAHVEGVTIAINVKRGTPGIHQTEKTHCPKGHKYSEANTFITSTGGRGCRECRRILNREWWRKNKSKHDR